MFLGDTMGCYYVFFFSSRRRHTRLVSDWSSDVCSSDLLSREPLGVREKYGLNRAETAEFGRSCLLARRLLEQGVQIGRASCRERVEVSGGGGSLKKKKEEVEVQEERGGACEDERDAAGV